MTPEKKARIEREATEAARAGHTLDHSCRYPWHTPEAMHFKAIYLLALPPAPKDEHDAQHHAASAAQHRPR
jgi:hypothetical protein